MLLVCFSRKEIGLLLRTQRVQVFGGTYGKQNARWTKNSLFALLFRIVFGSDCYFPLVKIEV